MSDANKHRNSGFVQGGFVTDSDAADFAGWIRGIIADLPARSKLVHASVNGTRGAQTQARL